MAYEDFTQYVEVDEDGDITVTATKCSVSTMRRDALSYVRADKGVDHFGDFEHLVTVYGSGANAEAACGFWMLSNGANTLQEGYVGNVGIAILLYKTTTYQLTAYDFSNDNSDYYDISIDTAYYLTIERSGTALTVKIYSDAARTTLLDTLSITCATTQYRYIFGVASRNSTSTPAAVLTGYSENLDLQLNQAPTAPASLECEGATNPTDVTDTTPEFTAIGNDPDSGDTLTHASIEVDDDSGFGSPIWQSGWIDIEDFTEGNRCAEISYAGSTPTPGTKYYWRIKFKDGDGAEGAWSDGTDYFYLAHSYTADAVLKGIQAGSFTADAVLKETQTGSFTADALLEEIVSITADAVLKGTLPSSLTADSVLKETQSSSFTADGILLKTTTDTLTVDAVLKGTLTGSLTADACLTSDATLPEQYLFTQAGPVYLPIFPLEPITNSSGSSTDNAIARFDGTDGGVVQNSNVTVDDSGNIITPGTVDGVDVSSLADAYFYTSQASGDLGNETVVRVVDDTGLENVFVGDGAGVAVTDGVENVGVGHDALNDNTGGYSNTALGYYALTKNTTGNYNTAVGDYAAWLVTTAEDVTAVGAGALQSCTIGGDNTAVGEMALSIVSTGTQNAALGARAGLNTSGSSSGNVFLGYRAGYNEKGSNRLYIDNSNTATPLVYGEFDNNILRIHGNLGYKVVSKTANYTAADENVILCNATSGSFTITLPAVASSTHRVYSVKKTDSSGNIVLVDGTNAETIEGSATQTLSSQYDMLTVVCDGSAYYKI